MAKFLFEETRYCFAYGQYLAVIVLGAGFYRSNSCGRVLRGWLEMTWNGRTFSELLLEARNARWLSETEVERHLTAHEQLRKSCDSFPASRASENIEHRMVEKKNEYPYTTISTLKLLWQR